MRPNLNEADDGERLETECGGSENAFRLMRLYGEARQDGASATFELGARETASQRTERIFRARARYEGYSVKAVNLMLGLNA